MRYRNISFFHGTDELCFVFLIFFPTEKQLM
uniref:Uncharacterized protein n=1 Tax=Arundo donax TaxID=35708 RepID=A0A0A9CH33_ARUDO